MKKLVTIITLLAILMAVVPAAAQTTSNRTVYVVLMADAPAATYDGSISTLEATRPGRGERLNPSSPAVMKYTDYLKQSHNSALRSAGIALNTKIYDYTYALNGFAVYLTANQAAQLARQPGVVFVRPDELRQTTTDRSPAFLGLTGEDGVWADGYTGQGVVVGVIDTGIWPEHPSFADDGSYAPPPVAIGECNFGNTAHNPNDAPFTCNNKLIGARQFLETYKLVIGLLPEEYDSARDNEGHGTHTASTAAGNRGVKPTVLGIPRHRISGIAPRALVVAYRACALQGCFTSDTSAAIDQAVADGVGAINYSIGGGASLTGFDDIAFLFAADAGVFVATSAGNSGPGAGTIGGPASVPWVTAVGASTQRRFFEGKVVLGNGKEYTGASITPGTGKYLPLVDAADLGNEVCDPSVPFSGDVTGKIVLCLRGVVGRLEKSLAVYNAGGAGMIQYNPTDVDNLFTDSHWVPSVHLDLTPGLAVKDYIHKARAPRAKITQGVYSQWPFVPTMAIFSSRGPDPVALDIIKPDVTAPGMQILAGYSPTPIGGVQGQLFGAIQGTSMSSPHVAGVFALIKQAHPDWSAAMAKSALMTSAYQRVRDNDRISRADPFDIGAGHINPGGKVNGRNPFDPGLVYDAGFFEYLGFMCSAAPEVFSDPEGDCAFLESIGVPLDPSDLNLASIGVADLAGTQTVVRTVTSVASNEREFEVSVRTPPGFKVVVSPKKLRLRPGESASYQVKITNVSAPVGEWRFGSLTWESENGDDMSRERPDGDYGVYSPIAVRAALFDAPAEISGAGASGSLSFDVKFGYTGSYSAAAHGLVPATVTSANVKQDPDQTFDPSDVGNGATLHEFTLSGAAFFRVAIPPEATEADADLGVFVFDPNGELIGASTKAGTDEVVDITLPMDGTWKVYVHGWAAPGGDSDYDLSSWVVSATPGGSLVLDSAPTSATLATSGTVQVSWSGLAAGVDYLGAVSHTGNQGLMGLTLVDVTTK